MTAFQPAISARILLCGFLLTGLAPSTFAADDSKKVVKSLQERIQRMQQAQQGVEQEKAQLLTEKTDLERQLKLARGEADRARSQGKRDAAELKDMETLKAEKQGLVSRLAELEKQLEKQLAEQKQSLAAASELNARRQGMLQAAQQEADQRSKSLASCEAMNAGLYKLNSELLERYAKAANPAGWRSGGVFTQLDKVRVENEAAVCQDKLDDLKLTPGNKPQN
jgi:chromosome segregation ATPase